MKNYIKVKFSKYKKGKKFSSCYFILLKLFIEVVLLYIYFANNKKGKEIFINSNIQYNNTIHLSLNVDDKYIYPCIIFLTSLLDNKANSTFYIIHILTDNNLSKKYMKKINNIIKRFGNHSINLTYYNLDGYFKNATNWNISKATYYKIVLPSLLPNVDKVIFADVDMINLEDLSEMYILNLKKICIFVV